MIAILIESQEDESRARKTVEALSEFGLKSDIYLLSALKTPELVVDLVSDFNRSGKEFVYIVISNSPALAGMVSASSFHPVVAVNSSNEAPQYPEQAPALSTQKLENAILAAVKIMSLAEPKLKKRIAQQIEAMKENY